MKNLFIICLLSFFCNVVSAASPNDNETDSLLNQLDNAITHNTDYMHIRESRINTIKALLNVPDISTEQAYRINKQLYEEYSTYICDSAILYLNRAIDITVHEKWWEKAVESRIEYTYLLSTVGLFRESIDNMHITRCYPIPQKMLYHYYTCCESAFREAAFYSRDQFFKNNYSRIAKLYNDSLQANAIASDSLLPEDIERRLYGEWKLKEALEINTKRLTSIAPFTPLYAKINYQRAIYYRELGDNTNYMKYLIISALSDIRSAVKENASLCLLADLLFKQGDIERAYNYIRFSLNDANFFNSQLRNIQISSIIPIIDEAYQEKSRIQKKTLQISLILISTLLLLLIAAFIYIYKQVRRLALARRKERVTNNQLNTTNNELVEVNKKLQELLNHLSDANTIKEEYIGFFLLMCSSYIDKMDLNRKMVIKRIGAGQIQPLLNELKSTDFIETEMEEFYHNFDMVFLNLFPNFVEFVNGLLDPNEQIVLKKGELLNAELRIFALIRLGIDDSSKIAHFLHYSVNTIYNYRVKIKNKAIVSRDEFESKIRNIGTFQQ